MIEQIFRLDQSIEQYIYLHRPTGADAFLKWATVNATLISFGLIFLLVVLYWINKNKWYLYVAVNAAILTGLTALITGGLKISIERLRPYKVVEQIKTPIIESGGFSFPSGHTTEVFTIFFTVFFMVKNKWLRLLFLSWAVLIAYTRMAFGVHFPIDILGGVTVALLSVLLWLKFEPLKKWFKFNA